MVLRHSHPRLRLPCGRRLSLHLRLSQDAVAAYIVGGVHAALDAHASAPTMTARAVETDGVDCAIGGMATLEACCASSMPLLVAW